MPKGVPNKRYTPEFKEQVIKTMLEEKLSYRETCRRFEINDDHRIPAWERIYLEEGPEGFQIERRGRNSTGRPRKLPKEVEEDLLAEVSYFLGPVKNVIDMQTEVQEAVIASERLGDILDATTEQYDKIKATTAFPPCSNDTVIEFDHVDFRYGNRKMILNDFTLHIHRGEKVALVGVSGCGKSTVSKLTMGFYKSEAGHVRINGVDIEDMPVDELRTIMAYVPQDTFLMSSSIRDNLLLGNKEIIPDTDLLSLKYKCGCQFVDELPFGLDTMLDENGANLSGGQRQRLAIVRALLRHPQILMLDEATSNLDATSEYELIQVIKQLDPSLTIITIAHRLNTIRDSDCIFVLEDGAVMEYGTHETLIQANTQYAHLWSCQSL